jgi:triphosphoribosyl-dephospho-CoA synthase
MLPPSILGYTACIWECTARKPGNVHPGASFTDTTYVDFLLSAAAMAPVLDDAPFRGIGATVLEGVRRTQKVVAGNTNLGMLLLLAPLAAAPAHKPLQTGVRAALQDATHVDARNVYEAIRLANPGGLGKVETEDVAHEPTGGLREVMALAADRDLIARQYVNGFRGVFLVGLPALTEGLRFGLGLERAIIFCHLRLMAACPDSLIARKRGKVEAEEAARRAAAVLDAGWPKDRAAETALAGVDAWLRAEGNGRNPGTTADLVAASLYVALREGTIRLPLTISWSPPEE